MAFDLKSFRENEMKVTQVELAELIGVCPNSIAQMEKEPETITLDIIEKIARIAGKSLYEIVNYQPEVIPPLAVKDTFEKASYVKNTIVDYIDKYLKHIINDNQLRVERVASIRHLVGQMIRKPRIAFIGRSDSGKSTMVNALLGKDSMPIAWSPTTSIIVYIKHIDDKPAFIEDDLWIFRKGKSEDDIGWDDTKLNDEQYCREWKIDSGEIGILKSYGTRTGDKYDVETIGSAVAFVDSPILKNVDLIDIPGFAGGRQSDHVAAEQGRTLADVLIYLSTAAGFISSEDVFHLKDAIRSVGCPEKKGSNSLNPLSNIYVVATHADVVNCGNRVELTNIIDRACEDFYSKTLTDGFWDNRQECSGYSYSKVDLRKRFFTYSNKITNTREEFESDLRHLVEQLPEWILNNAIQCIKQFCKDQKLQIDQEIDEYRTLIEQRDKVIHQLHEIDANESKRKQSVTAQKTRIISLISDCKAETRKLFNLSYSNVLDADHVIHVIKDKGFKNKKEDLNRLVSRIISELDDEMNNIIQKQSKWFSVAVNEFIADYTSECNFTCNSIPTVSIPTFNAERAFISGLAGLSTLGALGAWASTLGNLGGYILVAKGVGVLSALGISVGGGAAATAAVASIGGPITLAIGFAVFSALTVMGLLKGGWRAKAAKAIKKEFDKANALKEYCKNMDKYWDDTVIAFNAATDKMEEDWTIFVDGLRDRLENYNIAEFEDCIHKSEELKDFFDGILRIMDCG